MASFKKILKLVMVLGLVIFAYAVYIIFSESDPVELIDELEDSATEMVEESNKNIQLETAARGKTERIMEKLEKEEKDIMNKFEKQDKEMTEKLEKEEKRIMSKFGKQEKEVTEKFKKKKKGN